MTAKRKMNNRGLMLSEYVLLLGIVIAGILMVSEYLERMIKGNVAYMSDNYLGAAQETRNFPYNLSGGRQFVDQTGVYDVSGDTSTDKHTKLIKQEEFADGSRQMQLTIDEQKKSPGRDEFGIKALPDYRYPDTERKAYVPKFVKASDGYIDPPAMGTGGTQK